MASERETVLVTGAGGGIGRATAIAMAEAGKNVVCADINLEAAATVAATARQHGIEAMALKADVGDVGEIDKMIEDVMGEFGRLDVIVNNAGVTRAAYIMDLTEKDWDWMHRVNAKGVFFCLQGAARKMIDQGGGRIINIASLQSSRAFANGLAYGASKGGISQLTRAMAEAWSATGINCNAIAPGFFPTGLTAPVYQNPDMLDKLAAQVSFKFFYVCLINHNALLYIIILALINESPQTAGSCEYRSLETETETAYSYF